jgi:hypothetical protein
LTISPTTSDKVKHEREMVGRGHELGSLLLFRLPLYRSTCQGMQLLDPIDQLLLVIQGR